MRVKELREVFNDYKKTSLLIASCGCDFKCENEGLCQIGTCQNSHLMNQKEIEVVPKRICNIFNSNMLVESIIFGGLEPMLQLEEMIDVISEFRKTNNEDIVIYTGYNEDEIQLELRMLSRYDNIYVKFGRYIEGLEPVFDDIGGVLLSSKNQYFKKIS